MLISENNIALDIRSGSYCIYFMDSLKVIDAWGIGMFDSFEQMELTAYANYNTAQVFHGARNK